MKITEIQIRGFGKLNNLNIHFSDGLNVIYGENESGKSTLQTFIKASLFGLRGKRGGKEGAAALKRFLPWNGKAFSGYMNFTLSDGRTYRADSDFANGICQLFDESCNDISGNCNPEKLLGISEDLFERTVFVKQMGSRLDLPASKDLLERIANLSEIGEEFSVKNTYNILKEALIRQVGTDRSYTRPLDIINERLGALSEELMKASEFYKANTQSISNLQQLKQNLGELEIRHRLIETTIEHCRNNNELKALYERKSDLVFLNDSIKKTKGKIESLNTEISGLQGKSLTGNTALADNSENGKPSAKIKKAVYTSISVIVWAVTAIVLFKANLKLPWLLLSEGLALAVFGIIAVAVNRKGSAKNQAVPVNTDDSSRIALILTESLKIEQQQLDTLLKRKSQLDADNIENSISRLEKRLDTISEELGAKAEQHSGIVPAEEMVLINGILESGTNLLPQLLKTEEALKNRIQQQREELAGIEAVMKAVPGHRSEQLIEEDIIRLSRQKKKLEQRGQALKMAMEAMESAANEVRNKHIPNMNKRFNQVFSELTSNKYSDVRMGEGIMVSQPESKSIVPASMLSDGTIDQLYLALRIAAADTIARNSETLPMILDEPFSQYDDKRMESTLEYIYQISKKRQVIIFTCKQRERDIIQEKYISKIYSLT